MMYDCNINSDTVKIILKNKVKKNKNKLFSKTLTKANIIGTEINFLLRYPLPLPNITYNLHRKFVFITQLRLWETVRIIFLKTNPYTCLNVNVERI